VRLLVVDSMSGRPVDGLTIQIKKDFERSDVLTPEFQKFSKDLQEHLREWYATLPWSSGVTDLDGKAEVAIVITALDRTRGSTPPPSRDHITGEPYLVKVNRDQDPEEVLNLVMKPGEDVRGKRLTVTVVEISDPTYVRGR
jgi:hypothetical protein